MINGICGKKTFPQLAASLNVFLLLGLLKAAFSSYFLVFVPETKQIVD